MGRSNELFSQGSYEDAHSNFTKALAVAWAPIAADCVKRQQRGIGGGGSEGSCILVPRERWGEPEHSGTVLYQSIIHTATAATATSNNYLDHSHDHKDSSSSSSKGREDKDVVVAVLSNVTVRGNDGIITAPGGRVFMPSFHAQIPLHKNIRVGFDNTLPAAAAAVAGTVIMLNQLFAVGFYHFLLEIVPRLLVARRFANAAPLLVPSDGRKIHGFMLAIFRILGYDDGRLMRYPVRAGAQAPPAMTFERLITVDWVKPRPGRSIDDAHLPPPFALNLVRNELATPGPGGVLLSPLTVVWVQRSRARSRRIENEAELLQALQKRLPPDARLEVFSDNPSPSATSSFSLFSRGSVVVGLHGAGLANAVMMAPGGTVVEFALPEPHAQYVTPSPHFGVR